MVFNSRSYKSGEKKAWTECRSTKVLILFPRITNKQKINKSNHLDIWYHHQLQVPLKNCHSLRVGGLPRAELKRLHWLSLNLLRFGVVCLKNKINLMRNSYKLQKKNTRDNKPSHKGAFNNYVDNKRCVGGQ